MDIRLPINVRHHLISSPNFTPETLEMLEFSWVVVTLIIQKLPMPYCGKYSNFVCHPCCEYNEAIHFLLFRSFITVYQKAWKSMFRLVIIPKELLFFYLVLRTLQDIPATDLFSHEGYVIYAGDWSCWTWW